MIMKIAYFTETFLPKIDGIVTRLTQTLKALDHLNVESQIFCPGKKGVSQYFSTQCIGVPGFKFPLYPELKLAPPNPALILRELKKFKPDLIHVVNPAFLGLGGILAAKQLDIPLIASYHTHIPQYLHHYGFGAIEDLIWMLIRSVHNQARLNLCTSSAMVEELSSHDVKNVKLWRRGVDTTLFHPSRKNQAMREFLSEGNVDSPLLIYVGRLSAEKEIQNIAPILRAIPEARLALVGDGPYRKDLEKTFANLPAHFVGYLHGDKLASAFASSDLFVFPSTTETLGLVLLEAMAAGLPCIGARAGGIPDIITDEENGLLAEPNNEEEWIHKIQACLNGATDLKLLADAARSEAERWDWISATRGLLDYYEGALKG
jgi:glycosyltransferase involved in cell wall biosynthesis